MVDNPNPVVRWRNRAEELRSFADSVEDPKSRKALQDWASEYDKMIELAAKSMPPD